MGGERDGLDSQDSLRGPRGRAAAGVAVGGERQRRDFPLRAVAPAQAAVLEQSHAAVLGADRGAVAVGRERQRDELVAGSVAPGRRAGIASEAEYAAVLDPGDNLPAIGGDPHRDEIAKLAPGLVLRCIGMGEICQSWGGLLAGMSINPPAPWTFPGANQGSMVIAFRIDLFVVPAAFKREMDEYVRRVRELTPLPGFDRSFLAGGAEAAQERQYRHEGVPVGQEHRQVLEGLARDLGIEVPWQS